MAYDAVVQSRRLIAEGLPSGPVRLSRRRRFAPLGVDVAGDVAATRFLRRGVACYWDETHLLVRHAEAGWLLLGGGGGGSDRPWTAERFARERAEVAPAGIEISGSSSVHHERRTGSWGTPWIRSAELLAGRDVAVVLVEDRRLVVPDHGRLVVVWASRRPPWASARDAAGGELSSLRLSMDVRLPERYTDQEQPA